MSPSTFSLSLFAPFLRRSKKYKKLETDEPEKKKQDEANDELTRINYKIVSFFNRILNNHDFHIYKHYVIGKIDGFLYYIFFKSRKFKIIAFHKC